MTINELTNKANTIHSKIHTFGQQVRLAESEAVASINHKFETIILPTIESLNGIGKQFPSIFAYVPMKPHSSTSICFENGKVCLTYRGMYTPCTFTIPTDGDQILYTITNHPQVEAIVWMVTEWENILPALMEKVSNWMDRHEAEQKDKLVNRMTSAKCITAGYAQDLSSEEVCSVEWVILRSPDGHRWMWAPSSSRFDVDFDKLSSDYDTCGFSTEATADEINEYIIKE